MDHNHQVCQVIVRSSLYFPARLQLTGSSCCSGPTGASSTDPEPPLVSYPAATLAQTAAGSFLASNPLAQSCLPLLATSPRAAVFTHCSTGRSGSPRWVSAIGLLPGHASSEPLARASSTATPFWPGAAITRRIIPSGRSSSRSSSAVGPLPPSIHLVPAPEIPYSRSASSHLLAGSGHSSDPTSDDIDPQASPTSPDLPLHRLPSPARVPRPLLAPLLSSLYSCFMHP